MSPEPTQGQETKAQETKTREAAPPRGAKYLRGIFAMRSRDPLDTEKVELGANGIFLRLEREKEYTLPEAFWNAARDGVQVTAQIDPQSGREFSTSRTTYPFTPLGEGREEDFLALMRAQRTEKE
jgi:hypothetical protein